MDEQTDLSTVREREITALEDALACVIDGRIATYVSVPVTTGKRYLDWRRRSQSTQARLPAEASELHHSEVIESNRAAARALVQRLRPVLPQPLIDPSALADIPGWTQDDYRELWGRVIDRYAKEVVFTDGWQYSRGCAHEFLVAVRGHRTTLDGDLRPLTINLGTSLIQDAVAEMQRCALDTEFFENILSELV